MPVYFHAKDVSGITWHHPDRVFLGRWVSRINAELGQPNAEFRVYHDRIAGGYKAGIPRPSLAAEAR